jgi:hypothetical protein
MPTKNLSSNHSISLGMLWAFKENKKTRQAKIRELPAS